MRWITPDGPWQWKDVEELHDWVRRGRFTEEDAAEIRWSPDPKWGVPTMPEDGREAH